MRERVARPRRSSALSMAVRVLLSTLVVLLLSTPTAAADEALAEKAARDFLAAGCPDHEIESLFVGGPEETLLGIDAYAVRAELLAPDGNRLRCRLEVHPSRYYVTWWSRDLEPAEVDWRAPDLGDDQAMAIARRFAAAQFPGWGREMVAQPISRSGRFSGVRSARCSWVGQRDGIATGDSVLVSVGLSGALTGYIANWAVRHSPDEVRVPESQALDLVRQFIMQRARFDTADVTLSARLVLSHRLAAEEGPVWEVTARRPAPEPDAWEPTLIRYVDARTEALITPPFLDGIDGYFFATGPQEDAAGEEQ